MPTKECTQRSILASARIQFNLIYPTTDSTELDFAAQILDSTQIGRRTIVFTPRGDRLGSYSNWRWDFGDNTNPVTEAAPTHVYATAGTYTVRLNVEDENNLTLTTIHQVYPHEAGDPLKFTQWYLDNSGINPAASLFVAASFSTDISAGRIVYTYANNEPIALAGEDIGLTDPLDRCGVLNTCRGESVVVQVIDQAIQISHPEFRQNTSLNLSVNLDPNPIDDTDPFSNVRLTPPTSYPLFSSERADAIQENLIAGHGTSVAGIIIARDLNGIGIQGIAPRAELSSYNYLGNQRVSQFIRSLTDTQIDVSNNSWSNGSGFDYQPTLSVIKDAVKQAIAQGRGGLGTVFTKSSGNSGRSQTYPQYGNRHNSDAESINNLRYFMVVGSALPDGRAVRASEAGANVRLNAYENSRCKDRVGITGVISNPVNIVSTDLTGNLGFVYENHLLC